MRIFFFWLCNSVLKKWTVDIPVGARVSMSWVAVSRSSPERSHCVVTVKMMMMMREDRLTFFFRLLSIAFHRAPSYVDSHYRCTEKVITKSVTVSLVRVSDRSLQKLWTKAERKFSFSPSASHTVRGTILFIGTFEWRQLLFCVFSPLAFAVLSYNEGMVDFYPKKVSRT